MAIGLEYHHIDGAEVYKTETELGTAIKQSGVAREKLFVTTKVLPNIADIPSALKTSLKKLQMEYVDLFVSETLKLQLNQEASTLTDHLPATSSTPLSSPTTRKSTSRNGSRWKR